MEESAKQKVKRVWPDAHAECHEGFDGRYAWVIWTSDAMIGSSCDESEAEAWQDAASRIGTKGDRDGRH